MRNSTKFSLILLFIILSTNLFAARPVITGLTKTTGPYQGGSYVGVTGENFTKATYFSFGDVRMITKRFVNASLVYVMTIESEQGLTLVKAHTPGERTSLPYSGFTFTNEGPELDRLSLNNGPTEGSTVVHLFGRNFTPNMTIQYGEGESIRRYFYHSDRMYSYTPVCDLEEGTSSKLVDVTVSVGDQYAYLDDAFTFQREAPVITRIWPATGIKQGGTLVRVWGRNFRATDKWFIGDQELQFYIPNDHHRFRYGHSSFILLRTEDASDLTVEEALDLKVEPVIEGISSTTKTGAFTFNEEAPVFETVYPNKGFAAGSTVYIRGKNISRDIVTNFLKLDSEDPSTDINQAITTHYYHDGWIRVKTPQREVTEPTGELVDVRMENSNGYAYNYNGFKYLDLAPRIHYIYPNNGVVTGNQYVYIRGRNFSDTDMDVSFSTQPDPNIHRIYRSNFMAIKTNQAGADVPVDVTVTNAIASTTLNGGYVFTDNSPWVRSVYPLADTVLGNRNLYIYGENFTPDTTIQFDSSSDPLEIDRFYHSRAVRVRTPAHTAGKVDLVVQSEFGDPYTAKRAYTFRETQPTYEPGTATIRYISPRSGTRAGGTYVYLYGSNLKKETVVTLNDQPANIIHVHPNGKRILILTPEVNSTGSVDIKTTNTVDDVDLSFTLQEGFEYTENAPVVTMVRPAKGFVYGGTYVYVYGENLTKDVSLVLGEKKAILQKFYHSRLARFITAPDTEPGLVNVDVNTQFGSESLSGAYHYAEFKPEVRAITPNHGRTTGGNWIRIYGSFFTPQSRVYVGGVQVPESNVRYYHTRYIIAKAPVFSTSTYETVDIKVETEYGEVIETDSYTYVAPGVQLSFKN